jgi:hypothetical protein
MKDYSLLLILRSMDKSDIRQARKYLKTDYFNKKDYIVQLFNRLVRFHPDMNGDLIDEQKLYRSIFPNKAFKEKRWRRVRSELKTQLEDFLAYQNWRSDPLRYRQDLAEALRRHNDSQLYENAQQKTARFLKKNTLDGVYNKVQLSELYRQLFFHPHTSKIDAKRGDILFSELVSHTGQASLLMIFQTACEMQIRGRTNRSALDPFLMASAERLLELEELPRSPLIDIYTALYRSFLRPASMREFDQIRSEIIRLHHAGKTDFYNLALAYKVVINQMEYLAKERPAVYPSLFSWYEDGIRLGLYLENGQLSYSRFLNIALRMLGEKDFDRSRNFIIQFQDQLPKNERQSTVNLANAYWHYQRYLETRDPNSLHEAWHCTLLITNRQFSIELRFRSIRLRIIFEQFLRGMTERTILQYEIRSFQNFLKGRRDFPRRQAYGRLIRWIQKLATWKNKKHPSRSQLISYQTQIERHPERIELKGWLLNQVQFMAQTA